MTTLLTEKITFQTNAGVISFPIVDFFALEGATVCEKILFGLWLPYKVVAITIKCGTAITDTLKLRKIQ